MNIVMYNSAGIPKASAKRIAYRIASKFSGAGVKNINVKIKESKPIFFSLAYYKMVPFHKDQMLELRPNKKGEPALKKDEVGHNWGRLSAVDASVVESKTNTLEEFEIGMVNVSTHEIIHNVTLAHIEGTIMDGDCAADDCLIDPDLEITPEIQEKLQNRYNEKDEEKSIKICTMEDGKFVCEEK